MDAMIKYSLMLTLSTAASSLTKAMEHVHNDHAKQALSNLQVALTAAIAALASV